MKEKYKEIIDPKKGERIIDYYKVNEKDGFRYNKIKEFISDYNIFALKLVTTTMVVEGDQKAIVKEWEDYCQQGDIRYWVSGFEGERKKRILGIPMGKQKSQEYSILMLMKKDFFTEDFFLQRLKNYDIMIGVGLKGQENRLFEDYQKGYIDSFFECDYFEQVLYDSICIARIRIINSLDKQKLCENNKD
jgi:hypothetical protein